MPDSRPPAAFAKAFALLRPSILPMPILRIALGGLLFIAGCAGGPNVASHGDGQQVQSLDEVAVVSIRTKKTYENKIGEQSLADAENVQKAVRTIPTVADRQQRRADPDYMAGSKQVRNYLFGPFRSAVPFSLLTEKTVLQSPAYQALPQRRAHQWRSSLFATPQDYEPLSPTRLREASFRTLIKELPADPDGMLFAETAFAIVQDNVKREKGQAWTSTLEDGTRSRTTLAEGDTVTVDVEATLRIQVLDRSGNTALKVAQTGRSDEGFTFVYGDGWNENQIEDAARQATRAALGNMADRLQNNLPKDILARTPSIPPRSASSTLK
jgi:hypothetical protein